MAGLRPMSGRTRGFLVLAAILALSLPAAAYADQANGGDYVDIAGQSGKIQLGTVCPSSTAAASLQLAVARHSNGENTFANGSTVTFTASGGPIGGGSLNVLIPAAGDSVVLPSDWQDLPFGTDSSTVEATLTVTAGVTPGTGISGAITVIATGTERGGSPFVRQDSFDVTVDVSGSCPTQPGTPKL